MQNISKNTDIMLINIPTTGNSYFNINEPDDRALNIKYDSTVPIGIPINNDFIP